MPMGPDSNPNTASAIGPATMARLEHGPLETRRRPEGIWADGSDQGNYGGSFDNGCAVKGTCGVPYSGYGLGGGWQLCFA